jgi:excisionase family DNA binding protein
MFGIAPTYQTQRDIPELYGTVCYATSEICCWFITEQSDYIPRKKSHLYDNVRLNSVKDIVARTGLSRSKVYEELASGRLLSVKVGSRRLIPESALIDYIDRLIAKATDNTTPVAVKADTTPVAVGADTVQREKAAV